MSRRCLADGDSMAHAKILGLVDLRVGVYAALTTRVEDWRWGSLWRWQQPVEPDPALLSPRPIPRSPHRVARVNEALTDGELTALRRSAQRGSPFGDPAWIKSTAQRLGRVSNLNPRGRPQVRLKPNQKTTNPDPNGTACLLACVYVFWSVLARRGRLEIWAWAGERVR